MNQKKNDGVFRKEITTESLESDNSLSLLTNIIKYIRRKRIENRVKHGIYLLVHIKNGVFKKHPPIGESVKKILSECEKYKPNFIDLRSRQIICAACVYIERMLSNDVCVETRRKAKEMYLLFSCEEQLLSEENLKKIFISWFA